MFESIHCQLPGAPFSTKKEMVVFLMMLPFMTPFNHIVLNFISKARRSNRAMSRVDALERIDKEESMSNMG